MNPARQPSLMRSSSRIALLIVALGAAGLGIVHGGEEEPVRRPRAVPPAYSDSAVDAFTLIQPPTNDEYFPCSDCHIPEDEVNTTPRVLEEEHTDKVLVHGESSIWCLDCHDRQERDHLHAASGNPIEFGQSHKLCGQCHGRMYQEWKRGVHGKRLGNWSGPKEYLVCVSCHNPHSPQFKPLEPLPPPQRPEDHH